MEKSHQELLDEMASVLASLRDGVAALERKLSELRASSFVYDMNDILQDAEALSEATRTPSADSDAVPASAPAAVSDAAHSHTTDEAPAGTETKTVMDVLSEKEAWRKDMPGLPVKDVRSAISLNDRALFIRALFREDPVLFSGAVTEINSMDNLEQAVTYLRMNFPEWDMNSDIVYRFMMAVRRRVR